MLLPLLFGFLAKLRMFVNSKFCTFIYLYLHKRMRSRRQSKCQSKAQRQAKPGSQSVEAGRAGARRRQLGVSTRMFEWLPTTNNKQISSHGNAAAAVDVDAEAEEQRPNKQAARTTLTTFT